MSDKQPEVLWGAREIGRVIGRSERQTHYLLENKLIRSARKAGVGRRAQWYAPLAGLREQFCSSGLEEADRGLSRPQPLSVTATSESEE